MEIAGVILSKKQRSLQKRLKEYKRKKIENMIIQNLFILIASLKEQLFVKNMENL